MDGQIQDVTEDCDKADTAVCRARRLGASNLVECLSRVDSCRWRISFGEGQLCSHQSNHMIASGELLHGWQPVLI